MSGGQWLGIGGLPSNASLPPPPPLRLPQPHRRPAELVSTNNTHYDPKTPAVRPGVLRSTSPAFIETLPQGRAPVRAQLRNACIPPPPPPPPAQTRSALMEHPHKCHRPTGRDALEGGGVPSTT